MLASMGANIVYIFKKNANCQKQMNGKQAVQVVACIRQLEFPVRSALKFDSFPFILYATLRAKRSFLTKIVFGQTILYTNPLYEPTIEANIPSKMSTTT